MKEQLKHNSPDSSAAPISVEQIAEKANDQRNNGTDESKRWIENEWLMAGISFVLLAMGLVFDFFVKPGWFSNTVRLIWYVVAYMPVGLPVVMKGINQTCFQRRSIYRVLFDGYCNHRRVLYW